MALFKRTESDDDDDDMVSLADDNHAWWAGRDELQRAFVPKDRAAPGGAEPTPTNPSGFTDKYSTESLFNWASSSEPDDPTHGGTGLPLDPYRVLDLEPGATLSEVVAAHRTLAKRYHPDQLFDADDAERVTAAQKMSTINAAYHELRSRLMGPDSAH
ncbi:MAG TPA: J domain-containing protein [Acidimicrobiales bacterium]|nr:J domain-containing protein [Acidimicrobiales bacterium]